MLNIFKNKIAVSIFMGCSLIALSIQNIKTSKAASSAPSGACGAIMDISHKNVAPVAAGAGYGSNVLLYIDFTQNKISANATVANFKARLSDGTHDSSTFPTYAMNQFLNINMTVTAGPIANTWIITPASNLPSIIAISVNGGSTYLLQSGDGRGTGVCQSV
jgi:hypothetical protein